MFSGTRLVPDVRRRRRRPDITTKLLKGVKIGDETYKNHLDGYNQMDMLMGKAPSARQSSFTLRGPKLGAIRLDDMKFRFYEQPEGWPGPKVDDRHAHLVNLRQDPFERFVSIHGETLLNGAPGYMNDFMAREFWRFVVVQQTVAELAMTAIDYPPMQDPASFNLDAVKKKIEAVIKEHGGR